MSISEEKDKIKAIIDEEEQKHIKKDVLSCNNTETL